ncbi:MAG TPA: class I SAM-dependent methyltransferase [Saprospiraceae bacterium]|nr:SAM-dependent methyltransferase [Saprospirales bacterium]HRQ28876.1 class I SAM-dependent methyltransferase [Saprospiraceae bacterium]
MENPIKKFIFRALYWYISAVDKKGEIIFLNWGYDDHKERIPLGKKDEPNRYPIQLYHRLVRDVELSGKHIVEIGCGRGGGLSYIARTFSPASALGVDLEKRATDFGNAHYRIDGMRFLQGDAQDLPLQDESCDVVINVESSHRYPEMPKFLDHVYRILKPGGYFLITDFRRTEDMPALWNLFNASDFTLIAQKRINDQVVQSLTNDSRRRLDLVNRYMPAILKKPVYNFAGIKDSKIYKSIHSGELEYFMLAFKKNGIATTSAPQFSGYSSTLS